MRKPAHLKGKAAADILLVIPLQEELQVINEVLSFQPLSSERTPPTLPAVYQARTPPTLSIIAIVLDEMANENSAMMTDRCIAHFRPRLVVGIGIGGSLDKDVLLGDVVVSRNVTNVVFESKAVPDSRGGYALMRSAGGVYGTQDKFLSYFRNLKSTHVNLWMTWQQHGTEERKRLRLSTKIEYRRKRLTCAHKDPYLHVGPVASGPSVGAAKAYGAELKVFARDFRVLEMEGAGIALACTKRGSEPSIDFLLLRGVSDFSDERKEKLESQFNGKWRRVGAFNAAKLLTLLLDDPEFVKLITPRKTDVPELPAGKTRVVRIASMLNDTVHYVDGIEYGFNNELLTSLPREFELLTIRAVGTPEGSGAQTNEVILKELVNRFGTNPPDYVVTIGTAVSQAAVKALPDSFKIIFLGVSDPSEAGLLDRPMGGMGAFVAGVRYGLPIENTLKLLRSAFPGLVPVFVYRGDRYPQDTHLLAQLRRRFKGDEVELLDMEAPGAIRGNTTRRVYFGRFFLCRHIAEFVATNPRTPFVGVSPENVGLGAVMAIGHKPEQIGRIGARKIVLQDLIGGKSIAHGTVIEPPGRLVTVSARKLRECGLSIPKAFLPKVTWYEDDFLPT